MPPGLVDNADGHGTAMPLPRALVEALKTLRPNKTHEVIHTIHTPGYMPEGRKGLIGGVRARPHWRIFTGNTVRPEFDGTYYCSEGR